MSFTLPRLLAFDLDDTLLNPEGEISPRTRAALLQFHQRGTVVAFASGRMLPTMLPIAETLPFSPPLVSYNGAQVNLSSDTPPLYHRPVPAGLSQQVIDICEKRPLHLNFYHDNRLFVTDLDNWKSRTYREQTGAHLEYEPNYDRFRGIEPTKLIVIDEAEKVVDLLAEFSELFHGELTLTRSKPIYLEFLHPSVNKGAGFEALCRALDIPLIDTAAFGDAFNDMEMLRAAGIAVVVENGFAEVKAIAHHVCPSNAEDGVAQILEEWLAAAESCELEEAAHAL